MQLDKGAGDANLIRYSKVVTLLFEVFRNPWVKLLFTSALVGISFIGGYVSRLGWGFAPLVNRGEMVGSVLLVASIIGVFIRIVWIGFQVHFIREQPRETQFAESIFTVGLSIDAYLKNKLRGIAFLTGCFLFLVTGTYVYYDVSVSLLLFPLAFAIILLATFFLVGRRWRALGVFLGFSALTISFFSGSFWVDSARFFRASLVVKLGDKGEIHKVAIILRGQEGMFVFLDDDRFVSFIPWGEIKSIKSSRRGGMRDAFEEML